MTAENINPQVQEKEEEIMEFASVDEFAKYLMDQGVSPVDAVAQAQAAFNKAAEEQEEVPAPEPTPKKEEKKMKQWFQNASSKLSFSSKEVLIANLIGEKLKAETEEEKQEIQKFIDKLENDEGFYKRKVEPAVAKVKGWTVDTTGKVADTLYLAGDYTEKGTSGLTAAIGKGTQLVGKGIVKTGEFVEDNADKVGKVAAAPFKISGDAIKVMNGTKKINK